MDLASQQTLPVTRDQAWEALNDMDLLRQAIPGCESITATGENQFELLVAAAIGPVKARFKSKLKLLDIAAPESYTMQFDGQGGAAGFGKGTAKVKLVQVAPHETVLEYAVNAQVGGKIAQVGSRLVDMAAQKLAQEFFDNFRRLITERYPLPPEVAAAAPEPVPAVEAERPGGFFGRLLAFIRRLFGGR